MLINSQFCKMARNVMFAVFVCLTFSQFLYLGRALSTNLKTVTAFAKIKCLYKKNVYNHNVW